MKEQILCIPEQLKDQLEFESDPKIYMELIERNEVEYDNEYVQVIVYPYLITKDNKYLSYRRKGETEGRLEGLINPKIFEGMDTEEADMMKQLILSKGQWKDGKFQISMDGKTYQAIDQIGGETLNMLKETAKTEALLAERADESMSAREKFMALIRH